MTADDPLAARVERVREVVGTASRLAPRSARDARYLEATRARRAERDGVGAGSLAVQAEAAVIAKIDDDRRPATIKGTLWAFRKAHPGITSFELGPARALLAAYCNTDQVPVRHAPAVPLADLLRMASSPMPSSYTERLDLVVLFKQLRAPESQLVLVESRDVTFAPDRRSAEVVLPAVAGEPGRMVRIGALIDDPVHDPVMALSRRFSDGDRYLLPEGAGLRKNLYGEERIGRGPWLGAGMDERRREAVIQRHAVLLRRHIQTKFHLTYAFGGGCRLSDALRAREEHLVPDRLGLRQWLGLSKFNHTGRAESILLERRADALDPVAAYQRRLTVRQRGSGPLFRAENRKRGGPPRAATEDDMRSALDDLAELAGVAPFGTHSLRRTAASLEWFYTRDLLRVSTLLRHADPAHTVVYLQQIGVWDNAAAEMEVILG